MARYLSPKGDEIEGTLDLIPGVALITGIAENGEPEYAGETMVIWDNQTTQTRNGKTIFICTAGDEWTFDQLVKVEDDKVDPPAQKCSFGDQPACAPHGHSCSCRPTEG